MPGMLEDRVSRIQPRKAANLLLFVIAGAVVIFMIWAALTELDVTVRGQGRVIPSQQLQTISNLEGGIIERIHVRDGQVVSQGDPLITLDDVETGSEFGSNRVSVEALRAKIARLEGEVAGRDPVFPGGTGGSFAEQVEIERSLYASRMADLSSLTNAAVARVNQAERSVAEAEAALAARTSAANAAESELSLLRPLVERGIEPRLSLIQAENTAAVSRADAAAAAAGVTRAQAAVAEARASQNQQRQDWRARAATELAQAQSDLSARRQATPALQGRVDRAIVRAPLDGRINRVLKTTVGGSVGPGEPLVEMVPNDETLVVMARIRPQDIGWVAIGQEAKVNITAYDPTVYGGLSGEVVTISPDATLDERSGESFYEVRVQTDSQAIIDKAGRRLPIGPGMTADVSLIGEKRSIGSYILRPITRLQQRAFRE